MVGRFPTHSPSHASLPSSTSLAPVGSPQCFFLVLRARWSPASSSMSFLLVSSSLECFFLSPFVASASFSPGRTSDRAGGPHSDTFSSGSDLAARRLSVGLASGVLSVEHLPDAGLLEVELPDGLRGLLEPLLVLEVRWLCSLRFPLHCIYRPVEEVA